MHERVWHGLDLQFVGDHETRQDADPELAEIAFRTAEPSISNDYLAEQQLTAHYESARALYTEGLALSRELEDKRGIGMALNNLANVCPEGEDETRERLLEESLSIRRELGDRHGVAMYLHNLGNTSADHGDYDAAQRLLDECLIIRRELGDKRGLAMTLGVLGAMAATQGDYETARTRCAESLSL